MRFTLVIMYSRGSKYRESERGQSSSTARTAKEMVYVGAYEELFGNSDARMKVDIVAHPLFEQLVAAHVACLRAATPLEEQHIIDADLAKRHHVEAKYLALQHSVRPPVDNEELNNFMVDYILLLQSFKEQLLKHLCTEASEAMSTCQEIGRALFNLTGVPFSSSSRGLSTITREDDNEYDEKLNDGLCRPGINAFLPWDIPKRLRDHIRRELKQELNKDYHSKLKEVHDEIIRKRRSGRLPEDTTHLLKDWWITHAKWPYPTEVEKAQLMAETGLDLKQINNWFINQRKRKWQFQRNNSEGDITDSYNMDQTASNPSVSMELSLNCEEEETSFPDQL